MENVRYGASGSAGLPRVSTSASVGTGPAPGPRVKLLLTTPFE